MHVSPTFPWMKRPHAKTMVDSDRLLSKFNEMLSVLVGMSLEESMSYEGSSLTFVTVYIVISGEKKYALFFDCSRDLALLIAAQMAGIDVDEMSQQDFLDAFSEFGNIIGGEIKTLLDANNLGLPKVTERGTNMLSIPDGMIITDLNLYYEEYPARLTLALLK